MPHLFPSTGKTKWVATYNLLKQQPVHKNPTSSSTIAHMEA